MDKKCKMRCASIHNILLLNHKKGMQDGKKHIPSLTQHLNASTKIVLYYLDIDLIVINVY